MFDYRPGESFVHRLNPVTKLVVTVGLVVTVFLLPNFLGPALISAVLLCVAASVGVFWRLAKLAVVITGPLLVALLFVQGIFYTGRETPFVTVGPVTFWEEGLLYALLVFFRVLVVVCAVLITVFSTHPKGLMVSLIEKGLSPKLAYVFMASLQFIPEMQRRAGAIIEAQQARGLDIKSNLWRRFQALLAMMVPLLTGALISAETRSLALEARGFNRTGPRSYLIEVPDKDIDRTLRWSMLGVIAAAAVWRVLL